MFGGSVVGVSVGSLGGAAFISEGPGGGGGGWLETGGGVGGVTSGSGRCGGALGRNVPNACSFQVCMYESISRSSRSASPSSVSRLPNAALAALPPTAGMAWSRVTSTMSLYAPG